MNTDRVCQCFDQKDTPSTYKHFRSEQKELKLMSVFYLQICSKHKNSYPYHIFILRNFWSFLIMKFWFCKTNSRNLIFCTNLIFFNESRTIFGNFRSIHQNFKSPIPILTTISTKPIKFWQKVGEEEGEKEGNFSSCFVKIFVGVNVSVNVGKKTIFLPALKRKLKRTHTLS